MRNWVIHELLEDAAWQHPNIEVVSGDKRFTYAEAWDRVVRLSNSLRNLGIGKGTVVGVLDVNSYRYFELQYALSIVGAVVHTLNFRLPFDDLLYTVQHAGDELLFVWEGFQEPGSALEKHVRRVVWMLDSYEELVESGQTGLHERSVLDTDTFSIFYTTGTTGRPKGISYRHQDMLLASLQIAHHLAIHDTGAKLEANDTVMPLIPFFHIHGWGTPFFAPYLGAKLVLPEAADAKGQLTLIHNEGVTWSNMVPTQLHMLLQASQEAADATSATHATSANDTIDASPDLLGTHLDLSHSAVQLPLRVLTGGSPLPSGLAQRSMAAGINFSLIYGGSDQLATSISAIKRTPATGGLSSEAPPAAVVTEKPAQRDTGEVTLAALQNPAETKEPGRLQTLSTRTLPLPMVRVDIRDVDGSSVPRDGTSIGEVWVQSPWLPAGYVNDETRSREAFIDGWFKTGDLAVWYEDGSFYVLDRQKDAVKSGGEWITTSVIEAIISELSEVAMVAVLAESSEQWGERPLAVVQLKDGSRDDTEGKLPASTNERLVALIRGHLEQAVKEGRLAKFWIPDNIVFVESIPVTSAGKMHKAALRAKVFPS